MQKIKNFLFKNTSTKQTVAKNTFWLFLSEVIGRILKFGIVIFATRKLGVAGWGLFSYSLAYVGFFYFLGDFGISTFLTREMSKESADKYKYLSTAFITKIALALLFFFISIIIGPHLGKIRLDFTTILIFSIFFVSESIRELGMSINRSLEKMEREGFTKILLNLSIMIIGIFLISQNANPLSLILAYTTGSIISTLYIFWSVRNELKKIDWVFSKENLKLIYNFSWPIMILGFFGFISTLDSILLGQMKSATEVGLYSASQKLISFISILPIFISASIFPILSRNEANNTKLAQIFEKIMVIIIAIALPATIGGIFFSQKIILLTLGTRYLAATPTLKILMISLLACFPDLILNNFIYSKNLQKIFLKTTSFGLATNLILNLLLIPQYGAVGAAVSTVTAQLLIMTLNWRKLNKFIPFKVFTKLGKICLASILMTLAILLCNIIGINFIITILIAIIIYALVLDKLREPSLKELVFLIKKY